MKPRPRNWDLELVLQSKLENVRAAADKGGVPEGIIRILMACTQLGGGVNADAALLAAQARRQHPSLKGLSHEEIKQIVRRQALLVRLDPELALASLPKLLPTQKSRDEAIGFVNDLCASLDDVRPEVMSMLERVTGLLKRAPRGEGLPEDTGREKSIAAAERKPAHH